MTKEMNKLEKELRESWEVEFDGQFGAAHLDNEFECYPELVCEKRQEIKSFIRHLRSQDLARLRLQIALLKDGYNCQECGSEGWNSALSAVLEVIENYQSKD